MKKLNKKYLIALTLVIATLIGGFAIQKIYMNASPNNGWVKTNNTWYYYENGTTKKGWFKDGSAWYYLNPNDGSMAVGWKYVDGQWYFLNNSGDMATGWKLVNGDWYYLNGSGDMVVGWKLINGRWYYMYANGTMAHDTSVGGYNINSNGEWVQQNNIYTGSEVKQKVYGLGFVDIAGHTLRLNPYGKDGETAEDQIRFSVLSGNRDMSLIILDGDPALDGTVKIILNWILPTQSEKLWSIINDPNCKAQTIELDGRTIDIDLECGLGIGFGPIKK